MKPLTRIRSLIPPLSLSLVSQGLHGGDPLSRHPEPRTPAAPGATALDAAEAALGEDPRVTAALNGIRAQIHDGPSRRAPFVPRVPMGEDYRRLPVYQNAVRFACTAGWTGIGIRGLPVPPPPDYDLDRITAGLDLGDDGCAVDFDQVAERYEAGFRHANRVFHREETADLPAVTQ